MFFIKGRLVGWRYDLERWAQVHLSEAVGIVAFATVLTALIVIKVWWQQQ